MGFRKLRELVMGREAWHAVVHGVAKNQAQLSNWTELNWEVPPLDSCLLFTYLGGGSFPGLLESLGKKDESRGLAYGLELFNRNQHESQDWCVVLEPKVR